MKAIFAVTALAAAISAQAIAADTEVTTTVSGAVTFVTEIDLEGSVNADDDDATEVDVYLDEEDDADDGGGFGAYIDWDIVNGPFSANIEIAGEDDTASVTINDVIVSEGAWSFGQVGQLDDTVGYAHLMEEIDEDDFGLAEGISVDAGFRYTTGGLAIQLEGVQGTNTPYYDDADTDEENNLADDSYGAGDSDDTGSDVGIGAQYTGSADALSYVVEGQVRISTLSGEDDNPAYFVGAGATYSDDLVTVVAGVNAFSDTTVAAEKNNESLVLLGFEATITPTAESSVYGKGTMLSQSASGTDASSEYLVGATYQIDAIGLTAEYTLVEPGTTTIDNDSDFAFLEATMDSGALSYYASVELYMDESEADPLFEAGVSTTTESGITYAADFDFQADEETELTLTAAYSF